MDDVPPPLEIEEVVEEKVVESLRTEEDVSMIEEMMKAASIAKKKKEKEKERVSSCLCLFSFLFDNTYIHS